MANLSSAWLALQGQKGKVSRKEGIHTSTPALPGWRSAVDPRTACPSHLAEMLL